MPALVSLQHNVSSSRYQPGTAVDYNSIYILIYQAVLPRAYSTGSYFIHSSTGVESSLRCQPSSPDRCPKRHLKWPCGAVTSDPSFCTAYTVREHGYLQRLREPQSSGCPTLSSLVKAIMLQLGYTLLQRRRRKPSWERYP